MSDFSIPSEWLLTEIGELGTIYTGKTPNTKDRDNFNGGIPFVKPADLDKGGFIYETADYLSEKGLSQLPSLPKNSIMVTCIGNLGKVGIANQICATNQQINSIIPSELIDYKYLYYHTLTLNNWLKINSSATTVAIINKSKFSKAPIKLPPKAEQEKIAELLDSHLMQVENIKAQLNAIIPILKKFRQSVLADAVSGRLTNNLNLQTKKLKDITLSVSDGDHQSPPKSSNGVPFLVISDVSNGELNLEKASRFVPSDYFENLKDIRVPKSGDLLYTVTGSFGIPVIVHNDDKFCFQRHIAIIRPKKEQIDTSYLYYFLKSNLAFKQAVKTATGTAQKTVALSSLRNFDIILPTLKEQREIVERVEQLFAFADNINTQINNALQRVNHLTQSILHQAFTGQLTADWRAKHPELITGDNSAEKLLEQIQAAKQAQTPAKKDKAKMPKTTKAKPEQGQLL